MTITLRQSVPLQRVTIVTNTRTYDNLIPWQVEIIIIWLTVSLRAQNTVVFWWPICEEVVRLYWQLSDNWQIGVRLADEAWCWLIEWMAEEVVLWPIK